MKLHDGILLFGGKKNGAGDFVANKDGVLTTIHSNDCIEYSNHTTVNKFNLDLSPATTFGGFGTGNFNWAMDANSVFTAAAEASDHSIFLAGYHNNVTKIVTSSGYNCDFSEYHNFLVKLDSDGNLIENFNVDKIEKNLAATNNNGSISDMKMLNSNTLVFAMNAYPRGYLYYTDLLGNPKTSYGSEGFVYLDKSKITPFGLTIASDYILVSGAIEGDNNVASNINWSLTSVDLNGVEMETFKGVNNYIYSNGTKEGIYFNPILFDGNFYFLGTVRKNSNYVLESLKISTSGVLDQNYAPNLNAQFANLGLSHCTYCEGQIAIDNYGRLLVSVGTDTFTNSGFRKSYLVRLDSKGMIDSSFGNSGKIDLFYDYQAKVVNVDENKFLIYGDFNNSDIIGAAFHYDYGVALSEFTQLPPTNKISISESNKTDKSISFQIANYDSSTVLTLSSDKGAISFNSNSGAGVIDLNSSGRAAINLSVKAQRNGLGPSYSEQIFYTNYSASEIAQIQEAARIAAAAAEAERIAELRRQAEMRQKAAIQTIRASSDLSNLNLSIFQDAGVSGLNSEIFPSFIDFMKTLPDTNRSNIDLLNQNIINIRKNYYFQKLSERLSAVVLNELGFTGVSDAIIQEVANNLENTDYIFKRNSGEIQRIIDTVNILVNSRKTGSLSLADLKVMGIKITLPEKQGQILLKLKNLDSETFKSAKNVQEKINQITKVIEDRLKRTSDAKLRTQLLKERIASRIK